MSGVISPAVREQAAEWLLTLQADPGDVAVTARLQQWLQMSEEHRLAWQRVELFAARLQQLPPSLAHATLTPPTSPARREVVKALSLLLFASGAVVALERQTPWRRWASDRHTGTGERVAVTLSDGSRVEMNAASGIDTRFNEKERHLRLLDGEIMVSVLADPLAVDGRPVRPFVVETGRGEIRTLGSRFSVRSRDGDALCRVAVFDGTVELHLRHGELRRLDGGQQCDFSRSGFSAVSQADDSAIAWTQGMIVAQEMPLGELLAELSRHRPGHLSCDPALAMLPVTGTYPLADTDKVLDMLQATLPLQLRTRTRYWVRLVPNAVA